MPGARPIQWDICEEHLDEAAFLWGTWEQALVGASYALHDVVVGPEERLLAHLDALVLGGQPVAKKLLLPALASDDPGRISAAAWALLQAEDGDHLDAVMEAAGAAKEPAPLAALARAFELTDRHDLPERLRPLFDAGPPLLQGLIAGALACRQGRAAAPAGGIALDALLPASDPALRIAGLRALRKARDPALTRRYGPYLEEALAAQDAALREIAIETGIVLGMNAAWSACRSSRRDPAASRLSLALLALGGDPGDVQDVVANVAVPELRRNALWALGFAGTPEAAEAAIGLIGDEELAPLAAESFATITGLALTGRLLRQGQTDNSPPDAEADDAPPPELKPEDELPAPDADRVRQWWDKTKARFEPGIRHVLGAPVGVSSLKAALAITPMWRRRLFGLEVSVRGQHDLDARQWARTQQGQAIPDAMRMDRPLPALATF